MDGIPPALLASDSKVRGSKLCHSPCGHWRRETVRRYQRAPRIHAALAGAHSGRPPELFNAVLGWIEKGPDLEDWKKGEAELEGKHPQNDEAERYRKMWQRERLSWFQDKVPDLWKEKFADVLAKFPAPDHPEFPFYMSSGWVGPESPKSAAEIKKLSVTDLASFLSTWEPQNKGLMEATREGLGRTVTDAVKSDPERFSIEAKKFTGLDPTYVRAFLSALKRL